MKNVIITYFLVSKGRSNDDFGGARATIHQGIRHGAGFKTDDFVNETLGGLTLNDSSQYYNLEVNSKERK